ncbi:MAG TPA: DoxX family protein [Pseudonocardiaceae bacterium]|jgi:putative oxidoreductase
MVVGFLFACHGAASLFGILVPMRGGVVHPGAWPQWWAAMIELVGGTFVAVGLGTRIAAFICSGTMAYAYFVVHQRQGALPIQNHGELAALYAWLFLLIVVIGPGPISLDSLWRRHSPHLVLIGRRTSGDGQVTPSTLDRQSSGT